MAAIQQQMALFHHLENELRKAAQDKTPLTVRDLWERPEVNAVAKTETQVRDKVKTLLENHLLTKVTVAESQGGDKRGRIGYYWRDLQKTSDDLNIRKMQSRQEPKHAPMIVNKDVELVVNGITVVVGKNPETGRLRIVIE